jgi:predicted PurR-regulated permease PerM
MEERRPYTLDRVVRILFTVATIVIVLYLLDILKGVLLPFIVACLIAYMLEPIVKWNKRWMHLKSRFIPVIFTLIETLAVIVGLGMLVIPYIVKECGEMTEMVKIYATRQVHIPYLSDEIHRWIQQNIDYTQLQKLLSRDEFLSMVKSTISSSWNFLTSSVAYVMGILSWLVTILYVIFVMLDYERLMLSFRQLIPHAHRRKVYHIVTDIKNAMNRYFRGQSLIAFLVGVMFAVGFYIIGLPMGIVLGLFIGLLNMVPYLQLISLPITALLCLVWTVSTGGNFWIIFWESMAVYVVVQCIQDLILTPKIMGNAMGLNPAIILLSLSVWGSLLGFMGLIIALPLTTLLLSWYNLYVIQKNEPNRDTQQPQE